MNNNTYLNTNNFDKYPYFKRINSNYFRDKLESIPDYRKIVLLMFSIKNDKDLLLEIGFSERDINRLNLEFKKFLLEQHEEYLDYVKNKEESVEKFLNK